MKLLVLISICLLFSGLSAAQRISDADLGFDFTPPEGWQATKKNASYVMGSESTQGFMLIKTEPYKSVKSLKSAMQDGIEQADGSLLIPSRELTSLGKQGVSGLYVGILDGVEVTGFMMALMSDDKKSAAICVSIAPTSVFNQSNMDQLKLLLRSVQFN